MTKLSDDPLVEIEKDDFDKLFLFYMFHSRALYLSKSHCPSANGAAVM